MEKKLPWFEKGIDRRNKVRNRVHLREQELNALSMDCDKLEDEEEELKRDQCKVDQLSRYLYELSRTLNEDTIPKIKGLLASTKNRTKVMNY